MIRLICGENTYAIKERVAELKAKFSAANNGSDIRQADAADIEPADLDSLITNTSLFGQNSLVILSSVDDNKEVAERLPQLLDKVGSDTDLVIISAKPDKRTRWFKSVSRLGKTEQFDEKTEDELARWAVQRAKTLGAELRPLEAGVLVARTGLNQGRLSQELDKLSAYSRQIDRQSIELLVDKTLEESVFDLVDSVVKGRSKRAQVMYERLSLAEVDAHRFLALMSWQLHNMLVVKTNAKLSDYQLSAQAGLAPFVVRKTRDITAVLSLAQIKQMTSAALKTDQQIKLTRADSDARVKTLIDEIGLIANPAG